MSPELAIRILSDALTDIVNTLEPKAGEYDRREASAIYAVARAELALTRTKDAHDEACREDCHAA